jgi:hypothetical protein
VNELTDFLLARIAEDSTVAYAAHQDAQLLAPITQVLTGRPDEDRRLAHIYRWSPARVLAECAAKRGLVEDYLAQLNSNRSGWDARTPRDYPLRAIALPYADHPEYREDWRP